MLSQRVQAGESVAETGTSLPVDGQDACQDGDWNENITRYSTRVSSPVNLLLCQLECTGRLENFQETCNAVKRTCEMEE